MNNYKFKSRPQSSPTTRVRPNGASRFIKKSNFNDRPKFEPKDRNTDTSSERPKSEYFSSDRGARSATPFRKRSFGDPNRSQRGDSGFRKEGEFRNSDSSSFDRNSRPRGRFGGGRSFGGPKRFGKSSNFKPNSNNGSYGNSQNILEKYTRVANPQKPEDIITDSFESLNIDHKLKSNILTLGITKMTPIQHETINKAIDGADIVGVAGTGTGKTFAFLVPIIHNTLNNKFQHSLILAPTRELAEQIRHEIVKLTQGMRIFSTCVIGGASVREQMKYLKMGCHIIVGTPGRINDLIDRKAIKAEEIDIVVLDEVDRMLDMGFKEEVQSIIKNCKNRQQNLFFTATLEKEIESIINQTSKNPIKISVKKNNTSEYVHQNALEISDIEQKFDKLIELIKEYNKEKILVFVNQKFFASKLTARLEKMGYKASPIHGDMRQNARKKSIVDFKKGQSDILVATDVAARGIDIPLVKLVVNFDEPQTYMDYTHRIGRTGRAGNIGNAITFVSKSGPKRSRRRY